MATTTRAGIRRTAVHLANTAGHTRGLSTADGTNALVASTGGATTLADTDFLPPTGASTSLFANQWLYRPAAATASDRKRLVTATGYAAATQQLTHGGPSYTVNPLASGDSGVYLVLKDDPDIWNRAINEALTEYLFFPRFDEFSPVSATRRIYAVASAPISVTDLTRLSQIWGIEVHDENETANEERWVDWANGSREWRPFEDAGTLYIEFTPAFSTTQQVRLINLVPYAALSDETTASNVEEQWAAMATLLVMADWLADPDNPADEWNMIGRKMRPRYEARRRAILGRYAYRQVSKSSTYVGGVSVGGRAGRGVFGGRTRSTFHN